MRVIKRFKFGCVNAAGESAGDGVRIRLAFFVLAILGHRECGALSDTNVEANVCSIRRQSAPG